MFFCFVDDEMCSACSLLVNVAVSPGICHRLHLFAWYDEVASAVATATSGSVFGRHFISDGFGLFIKSNRMKWRFGLRLVNLKHKNNTQKFIFLPFPLANYDRACASFYTISVHLHGCFSLFFSHFLAIFGNSNAMHVGYYASEETQNRNYFRLNR